MYAYINYLNNIQKKTSGKQKIISYMCAFTSTKCDIKAKNWYWSNRLKF